MTEKEKMLTGKAYNACENGLFKERQDAKELVFAYNTLRPSEVEKRTEIIIVQY